MNPKNKKKDQKCNLTFVCNDVILNDLVMNSNEFVNHKYIRCYH